MILYTKDGEFWYPHEEDTERLHAVMRDVVDAIKFQITSTSVAPERTTEATIALVTAATAFTDAFFASAEAKPR